MRAIGAELGATTTGEQRKGAASGSSGEGQMPAAGSVPSYQIPSRERKRAQIVERTTFDAAGECLAGRESQDRRVRLPHVDEVAAGVEQFGKL
jgi:hypothetical protein